jgi:hypothetical protein
MTLPSDNLDCRTRSVAQCDFGSLVFLVALVSFDWFLVPNARHSISCGMPDEPLCFLGSIASLLPTAFLWCGGNASDCIASYFPD